MPNWCFNSLSVTGPAADLENFIIKASGNNTAETLSLDALYPLPEDEDWYEWQTTNWSTKWDINKEDLSMYKELDVGHVSYSFPTAWSPPVNWLIKVCKDFPELSFELIYEESGEGYAGVMSCVNGVAEDNTYYYGNPGYREFCIENFGDEYFPEEEEDEE